MSPCLIHIRETVHLRVRREGGRQHRKGYREDGDERSDVDQVPTGPTVPPS